MVGPTCNDLRRVETLERASWNAGVPESKTPIDLMSSLIPFIMGRSLACSPLAALDNPVSHPQCLNHHEFSDFCWRRKL